MPFVIQHQLLYIHSLNVLLLKLNGLKVKKLDCELILMHDIVIHLGCFVAVMEESYRVNNQLHKQVETECQRLFPEIHNCFTGIDCVISLMSTSTVLYRDVSDGVIGS